MKGRGEFLMESPFSRSMELPWIVRHDLNLFETQKIYFIIDIDTCLCFYE
jgi:hypothetical protein